MTALEGSRERAWEDMLRALEQAVEHAATLLEQDDLPEPVQWAPPTDLGQLPPALAERARALLTRQQEVSRLLSDAVGDSRRENRLLSRLRQSEPRPPVYLDMPV